MNEIMTTVFGLAGGLAMFLFGMNSYLRCEHRPDDDRPADGV